MSPLDRPHARLLRTQADFNDRLPAITILIPHASLRPILYDLSQANTNKLPRKSWVSTAG